MSSLRVIIFENSKFVAEIYFIFLKTSPRSNFKCFQYQIRTSVKKSQKQLSSKTNFITSFQIIDYNFRLKLCQSPQSYQNLWNKSSLKGPGASQKQNIVFRDSLKNFLLHFMSSLRVKIFENSNFVAEVYIIFLKTPHRSNFKCFQYQIWTSVKKSEKQLSSKRNFMTSLQNIYYNFRLKLY